MHSDFCSFISFFHHRIFSTCFLSFCLIQNRNYTTLFFNQAKNSVQILSVTVIFMDSRLIIRPRALKKPLLLKDYLLDDMSSCSSNGFQSFPRRQCCTFPFLHEFDLKTKQKKFNKTPPKSSLSAFQIAMTAVKRLPFSAAKSPEKKKVKNSFLPRSLSRKILKRSGFWKRKTNQKEIGRSKRSDEVIKDDSGPPDRSCSSITASERKINSCSSCDSSSVIKLPEERNDVVEEAKKMVSINRVDVTNDDVSTDSTTSDGSASTNYSTNIQQKQWSSEEKEQFSPVSVLECPFDDEDDEVSSPFQHRLARVEETNKKLMKKIQMFEGLANLKPVNLANLFALQPDSDNEYIKERFISDIEEEEEEEEEEDMEKEAEQKALELLHQMKVTLPPDGLKLNACTDKLLLDFFIERVPNSEKQWENFGSERILEEAEDWINGQRPEVHVEWDVQKNREAYVKEMERKGEWKTLDQENKEVSLELESEVFASLLNELVLDISIQGMC